MFSFGLFLRLGAGLAQDALRFHDSGAHLIFGDEGKFADGHCLW
jgi:hypothetical protein